MAQFARAAANLGDIDGQDQRFITSITRALHQFECAGPVTAEVKLEPCMALGCVNQCFQRGRGNGRDAQRHFFARGQSRQHQIGTVAGEVAHTHGCDSERGGGCATKQRHGQ